MSYTESAMRDKIREILNKPQYSRVISALKPNSVYNIDVESEDFSMVFGLSPVDFKERLRHVIYGILEEVYDDIDVPNTFADLQINLVGREPISMHDIGAHFENTVITFDCIISATDAPKTYVKQGTAVCPQCFNQEDVKCDFEKKIQQPTCPNPSCKRCKMIMQSNSVVTDDVQTLLLQEQLEDAVHSSPVTFVGKVYGNDVSTSFTGQKKRITGIFRSIIDMKENENDVYIDILALDNLEEEEDLRPTVEQEKKFREMAQENGYTEKIVGSFAPRIYGMKDIKLSILLQLVGGVKGTKRSDINIFLVGDPSMAKSELLKYANSITHKSIYTSGRGTSSAGLTIAIVKINDRFVAQAGVLPLCNGGFAFIDEFDKMNKDDRSAMHEAMEQQTVSIAKAGIVLTLPTKTAILASANPKYGFYDNDISLRDNVDIPAPLLSRFDLIWLIKDTVNMTEDMLKASHIINSFEDDVSKTTHIPLEENELVALMTLAKEQNPKLTEEVKAEIIKIYNDMRAKSKNDELPIGTRQLEALVRLSYAHAKLMLKDFVEVTDVMRVKELIESMYGSFNLSISSGSIQTVLGTSNKETKQQTAERAWSDCENEDGKVNLTDFMRKLVEYGYEPMEAKKLFGNWERFNHVRLNNDGTYRKA